MSAQTPCDLSQPSIIRRQQARRALDALLSASPSSDTTFSYLHQPLPPNKHDTQADPPLNVQDPDRDSVHAHTEHSYSDDARDFPPPVTPQQSMSIHRQQHLQRQQLERQLRQQQQKQQQLLLQQHDKLRLEHQVRLTQDYSSQQHGNDGRQRRSASQNADEAEDADEEDEDEEREDEQDRNRHQHKHHPLQEAKTPGDNIPQIANQGSEGDPSALSLNPNRPRKYNKSKANGRGTSTSAPRGQYKKTILRQQAALLAAQLKEENKTRDSEATRRVLARTGVIKHLRSLKSRLALAQYKVGRGWEEQPLPIVTELFEETLQDSGDSTDEDAVVTAYGRTLSAALSTAKRPAQSHHVRPIRSPTSVDSSKQDYPHQQPPAANPFRALRSPVQGQDLRSGEQWDEDRDSTPAHLVDSDGPDTEDGVWDTPLGRRGSSKALSLRFASLEKPQPLQLSCPPSHTPSHHSGRAVNVVASRSPPSTRLQTPTKSNQEHQPFPGVPSCSETESEQDSGAEAIIYTPSKTGTALKHRTESTSNTSNKVPQRKPSTHEELQRQQKLQLEELQKRQLEQLRELQKLQQEQQLELQRSHVQLSLQQPTLSKTSQTVLETRNRSRSSEGRPAHDKENQIPMQDSAVNKDRRQGPSKRDVRHARGEVLQSSVVHDSRSSCESVAKTNALPSHSSQITLKERRQRPPDDVSIEQSHDERQGREKNVHQAEYRQLHKQRLQENEEKEQELLRMQRRLEHQQVLQQKRKRLLLQLQQQDQQDQQDQQRQRKQNQRSQQQQPQGHPQRPEYHALSTTSLRPASATAATVIAAAAAGALITPKKKKPLNPVQKAPSTENILASVRSTQSNVRSALTAASPALAAAKNILLGSKRVLPTTEDKENFFASPKSSPVRQELRIALPERNGAVRQSLGSKGIKRQRPAATHSMSPPRVPTCISNPFSMPGSTVVPSTPAGLSTMAHTSSVDFTTALVTSSSPLLAPAVIPADVGQSNKEFLKCFDLWMSDLGSEDVGLSSLPPPNVDFVNVPFDVGAQGGQAPVRVHSQTTVIDSYGHDEGGQNEEAVEEAEDDAAQTGQSGQEDEAELDDAELDRLLYSEVGDDYFYASQGAVSTPGSDFGGQHDLTSDPATPDLYDWFQESNKDRNTTSFLTVDQQHLSLLSTDPILSSSPAELAQGLELELEFDTAGDPLWLQQELQIQRRQQERQHLQQQEHQEPQEGQGQGQGQQLQQDRTIIQMSSLSRDGTPQLDSATSTLLSSSFTELLPCNTSTLIGSNDHRNHYVPMGLGGEPMSESGGGVQTEEMVGKDELLLGGHPASVEYFFAT
ncbi:hypothetical protein BGX28_008860 [Mortierella sp. GBA30]|nr:hypothetical protein BGX28_008860 [Mortierella sp. GBA30]